MNWYGLDSSGLGYGPAEDSCESIYMKVNVCICLYVPALLSFREWYSSISLLYLIV
jgi:hypothetical protein